MAASSVHLTILAAIALYATDALACSCAPPGPNRCALPDAPVAFTGKVISKQAVDLHPPMPLNNRGRRLATDPPPPADESYIAVTFQVTEWFRGGSENTLVVRTYPANNSCTYPFEVGRGYLVFASMKDGNLRTDPCAGTRPIASEIGLIYQLRSAREGKGMADAFGMGYLDHLDFSLSGFEKHEGVPGLTVSAKSDRGEYETVTSTDGVYEFRGLPPARYDFTAQAPGRLITTVRTLDVGRGSACRVDFQVSYDARISGTVVNARGEPVSGSINAYLSGHETGGFLAARVDEGRFEFERVPPGRYRLRFWSRMNGQTQPVFYPGTAIEAAAGDIEIGDGTHLEGLQFTLP